MSVIDGVDRSFHCSISCWNPQHELLYLTSDVVPKLSPHNPSAIGECVRVIDPRGELGLFWWLVGQTSDCLVGMGGLLNGEDATPDPIVCRLYLWLYKERSAITAVHQQIPF